MSREQNIKERDDLFKTLLNDPEFAEAVEALNSLSGNTKPKTPRIKRKNSNSDRSFRSKAAVPVERRQSLRLKNKPPTYTKDDLIDDSVVKMTEKERNRARFSEEYLQRISERQKEFWKNYWQKKREEKAKCAADKKANSKTTKKKSRKGFSQEYLKELSARRTEYWKDYWRIRREEKAKMEAENKSWKAE